MSVWINGRRRSTLSYRDRGLQYGDGVFETMKVRRHGIRLLDFHLDRLYRSCRRLKIQAPTALLLRRELERIAAGRKQGVLKLMVTRGRGPRGYRPTGRERATRIVALEALPRAISADAAKAVRLRVCATRLSTTPSLAGLKTLNRLDSVLARSEWTDARIWEGLMRDVDGNWVCGTMSNLFLRRGTVLMTPLLDRCGVAGVMRRWVLESAANLGLRAVERRIRWEDLQSAEEVFMSNAVVGIRSVRTIECARLGKLRFERVDTAAQLRSLLDRQ
ncbi:MAG TPA: aminodeoxychorismate lyase [Steroidobacteraceae bacterium]|nr:aminodeoxychorismate lyase [Steroidobacteraceae bacterium]